MNGHWCDQAEIMKSIAARGRLRGCYEWALVRPGRDYGIYRRSGARGCYVMNGRGLVRPGGLQNLSLLNPSTAGQSLSDATEVATYVSVI